MLASPSSSSSSCTMRSLLRLSSATTNLLSSSGSKNLHFLILAQNPSVSALRFFGSSRSPEGDGDGDGDGDSFAVSYLVEKCGFHREDAVRTEKSLSFTSPEKPDSVVEFFRSHGFTQAQMSHVIAKFPKVLSCNPEKTLSPKFDFFKSKGFSGAELRQVISVSPWILGRSLEGHIVPSFDFISNVIRSEKKTLYAIKRYPSLITISIEGEIVSKMNIFREHGVPVSNFGFFLFTQPRLLKTPHLRLKEIFERVKDLGICPSKLSFVIAVQVLCQLSQSTWDKKLKLYSRWGWTEEMTLGAFAKYPLVMMVSEHKINAVMDYFTKQAGVESSLICEYPLLMKMSLEKRTVPRYSVITALRSKGLIGDFRLSSVMGVLESKFLEKYVYRFPLESDHLLSLYRQKTRTKAETCGW